MSNGNNLVFVTRPSAPCCDGCGRPTHVGFEGLVRGTPVLFDCAPCAVGVYGREAVKAAIEADRQLRFEAAERGAQW